MALRKITSLFRYSLIGWLSIISIYSQPKANLEEDGLCGKVYSVRTYEQLIQKNTNENASATLWKLRDEKFYDLLGNRTIAFLFNRAGQYKGKINYHYGLDQSLVSEAIAYDATGQIIRQIKYFYDEQENLTGQTNYEYNEIGLYFLRIEIEIEKNEVVKIAGYNLENQIIEWRPLLKRGLHLNDSFPFEKSLELKERPVLHQEISKTVDVRGSWIKIERQGIRKKEKGETIEIVNVMREIQYYE